jgi:hypothetical protein
MPWLKLLELCKGFMITVTIPLEKLEELFKRIMK